MLEILISKLGNNVLNVETVTIGLKIILFRECIQTIKNTSVSYKVNSFLLLIPKKYGTSVGQQL